MSITGLPDGRECFLEVIDEIADRLDSVVDREKLQQIVENIIPCRIGLVCRLEELARRVCRPEINGTGCDSPLTEEQFNKYGVLSF